jgi:hypothetical protein
MILSVTSRVTEILIKVISKYLGANTILDPPLEFKNVVYISNYNKINPNSFFKENLNFWPSFAGNLLFLAIRCNKELASQILLKSKVPRIFSEFFFDFNS